LTGVLAATSLVAGNTTYQTGKIEDTGTFTIQTNGGDDAIICTAGAGITLYHGIGVKLITTATGVTVTGDVIATTATLGTTVYEANEIDCDGSFTITVNSDDNAIVCTAAGAVTLYHDDVATIATLTDGMAVTGDTFYMPSMKSGTDQADAGAAAGELYFDTNDDNTVKMGV